MTYPPPNSSKPEQDHKHIYMNTHPANSVFRINENELNIFCKQMTLFSLVIRGKKISFFKSQKGLSNFLFTGLQCIVFDYYGVIGLYTRT